MELDEYMKEMQDRLKKKYEEYIICKYQQKDNIHQLEALILITDQCNDEAAEYTRSYWCREPNLVDLEEFEINASKIFEAILKAV